MKKKVIAMLLACTMVMGMAGCGSEKNAQNQGTESKSAEQTGEAGEENHEKPEVSLLTIDFSGNALAGENADKVKEAIEEYTNTKVEWNFGLSDAYDDKLTLMLASGDDTPMIVTVEAMNSQTINYAKAGAFWDLSEFINEKDYPNLAQMNQEIAEQIKVDGKLIGIYRSRSRGRYGLGYRKDWAENLGYTKEPETIDEVYQLMYDFTYGDPDGNGKDDTYGLELCSYMGPLDVMQTWFGVGNKWYEDENGKLLPVHMSEEYMEALQWFKKCYDEGLWASDWATRETSTWSNDVKNGLAGMYCDTVGNSQRIWQYMIDNHIPSVTNSEETASMVLCHSIGKTPETKHNFSNSGYGGFLAITKSGAKTEEDVKNCLHFLDKMCDDEMAMLINYGIEGIHWERGEGDVYVDIRKDKDKEQQDFAGTNQIGAGMGDSETLDDFVTFEYTVPKQKEMEVAADNENYAVMNPAAALLMQSETYTLNGANLDVIIDDARTNYIIGAISEEELKQQWDVWYQSGGEKIIEEINAIK